MIRERITENKVRSEANQDVFTVIALILVCSWPSFVRNLDCLVAIVSRIISSCCIAVEKLEATCFMFLARLKICFSSSLVEIASKSEVAEGLGYIRLTPNRCCLSLDREPRYLSFRREWMHSRSDFCFGVKNSH